MPSFSFSVNNKSKRKEIAKIVKYEVVQENVYGVVFVDDEFKYRVVVRNTIYDITPSSFTCKNKRNLYPQILDKNKRRILYIRTSEDKRELDSRFWLPFAVGVVVRGDLVNNKNLNEIQFKVKKACREIYDDNSKIAMDYYKEHYEELQYIRHVRLLKSYE